MSVLVSRGNVGMLFTPPHKRTRMKLLFLRFKHMPRCIQRECPNRQQTCQLSPALVYKARWTVCTLLQYSDETETAVNPALQSCQLISSHWEKDTRDAARCANVVSLFLVPSAMSRL